MAVLEKLPRLGLSPFPKEVETTLVKVIEMRNV